MPQVSKKPRIGLLSFNAYAFFNPASTAQIGGSEQQMYYLADYLAQAGYEVSFIVGDFGQLVIEKHGEIEVIRSIPLRRDWLAYVKAPVVLWQALRKSGADIFIASPAGPEVGLLAIYCYLFRKKYIFRTASAIDCTLEKIQSLGLVAGWLYQFGLRRADLLVCQSEQAKTDIKTYHQRDAVVVKNMVLAADASADKEFVLWVGSARTVKQPDIFLELARQMPGELFTMVMSRAGDQNIWAATQKAAKEIPNVRFVGEVPPADIGNYFARAKLLVGTSRYEGWPNVYMQAASYGVPIISLQVNPDNFLRAHSVGYVADGDRQIMLGQVQKILADKADYAAKSAAGPVYVQTYHGQEMLGSQWQKFIAQIWPEHSGR